LAPQLLEGLYLETTMQPPSLSLVKQLGPHLVPQIPLVPPGHLPLVPLALEVLKWEVWEVLELMVNLKPKHRVNKVKVRLIFNIYYMLIILGKSFLLQHLSKKFDQIILHSCAVM
jgi:hypothetical protein